MDQPVDTARVLERVGWLRMMVGYLDGDLVRLGDDVRGGVLVDRSAVAARMAAIEELIQVRRDEVTIWRAYLSPPRTWIGRTLMRAGAAVVTLARRVG